MNLKSKVFLILVVLTITPLIILSFAVSYTASYVIKEKVSLAAASTINNLVIFIARDIQDYQTLTFVYSRRNQLIESLRKADEDTDFNPFYSIKRSIIDYEIIHQVGYPFQYAVISNNGKVFFSYDYYNRIPSESKLMKLVQSSWYKQISESMANHHSVYSYDNVFLSNGSKQIYFASNIWSDFKKLGMIIIGIDEYYFSRLLANFKISPGSAIFILDENSDLIIPGENNPFSYESVKEGISKQLINKKDIGINKEIKIAGEKYLMFKIQLPLRDVTFRWSVLVLTPIKELSNDVNQIYYINVILILFSLIAILFLTLIMNRVIIKPIENLSRNMELVSVGNLEITILTNRSDEIGILENGFNTMILSLKDYIRKVEIQEKNKREMEIQILQSQINPHFLRNTLNTIKWMAEIKQANGITNAIVSLSRLLDYYVSSTECMVSVRRELDSIMEYVNLQKLRYQNKFTIKIDVEGKLLENKILKLSFQPIIENSIMHGFASKRGQCTIILKGLVENNCIIFTIADNGVGIDDIVLNKLLNNDAVNVEKTDGIALKNIDDRIKLHFGENYGIKIYSKRGKGTEVIITMPVVRKEEVENENNDY